MPISIIILVTSLMVTWLLLSASSSPQHHLPVCTWCRGGGSWGPWRLSGWACRRKPRWPDPVSVPDSGAGNGCTGSTEAGSLPPQSHSCPAATAAKKHTEEDMVSQSVSPNGPMHRLCDIHQVSNKRGAVDLIITSKDKIRHTHTHTHTTHTHHIIYFNTTETIALPLPVHLYSWVKQWVTTAGGMADWVNTQTSEELFNYSVKISEMSQF